MDGNVVFKDKESMNKFRRIIDKALREDIITEEEAQFSIKLSDRFRTSIETKTRQLYSLQGEIARIKENEADIFDVAESMISDDSPDTNVDDIESVSGLLITINNRFKSELERKARALLTLQGEIAQLKANEKVLLDIIGNVIAAHERAVEREAAVARVREGQQREGVVVVEDNS